MGNGSTSPRGTDKAGQGFADSPSWPPARPLMALTVACSLLVLCLGGIACSSRDRVGAGQEEEPTSGSVNLEVTLLRSLLPESTISGGPNPSRAEAAGENVTVTVRIVDAGNAVIEEVSRSIDGSASTATFAIDLPDGAGYRGDIEVIGARTRPTGTTDVGLLHRGSTNVFTIAAETTTPVNLVLNELVPQLWLRETAGLSHELRWSPVVGAVGYRVQRAPDDATPVTFSSTALDTTIVLPPGFWGGGTGVTYRVQAELAGATTSAFSEPRSVVEPGTVPPNAVSDLDTFVITANEIVLRWTAPGDDGAIGRAARYDLRRSTTPITEGNFLSAQSIETAPPNAAGTRELAVASGLLENSTVYFALITYDEADNPAPLSNVLVAQTPLTPDLDPPAPIADVSLTNPAEGSFRLAWTAPADDRDPTVAEYEVRYSSNALTSDNFPAAVLWATPPAPGAPGTQESQQIEGLVPGTYYFAIRSRDGAGNVSAVSNVASANSADTVAPDAVSDLTASELSQGRVRLRWTASGDNARSGHAARHEVRYSSSPIDATNFAEASLLDAPGPAEPGSAEELEANDEFRAETPYYFAVRTFDEAENAASISNVAMLTTSDFEAPDTIEDVVAEEVTGTRARMFWTAPGDNRDRGTATSYDMRFSFQPLTEANFASASQVGNMPSPSPPGTNEEVTLVASQSVEVYLGLRTSDENEQNSGLSNVVFVRFGDPPPDAPTGLTAAAEGPDRISLAWEFSGDEDYFEVERKTEGSNNFQRIGVVDRNGFLGAPGDGPASIRPFDPAHSADTPAASVRTALFPDALSPAAQPLFDDLGAGSGAGMREQAVSISIHLAAGSPEPSTPARRSDPVEAVNTGLTERTTYTYRIRAFSAGGPSGYSNEAGARTTLAPPEGLTVTQIRDDVVRLDWTQVRNPETFEIARAINGGTFTTIGQLAGSLRQFDDSGLSPRTTYDYRVRATAEGQSTVSDPRSITTDDEAPVCSVESTLLDFGFLAVGSRRSLPIFITNTGGGRLQASAAAECSQFLVEDAPFDLGPGERAVREVVFLPTSPGEKACTIAISGGCETVRALGAGVAPPTCSLGAALNNFGTVTVGESADLFFFFSNVGGGLLTGEVEFGLPFPTQFQIIEGAGAYSLAPGQKHRVTVRFAPTAAGSYETQLDLGTEAGCPEIDLFGTAVGGAACVWVDPEIDFGAVTIGESVERRFQIRNDGSSTIAGVVAPTAQCNGFSFEGTGPYNLNPGRIYTGLVVFAPTEAIVYEGCSLRIDAAVGPPCPDLPITGRGAELSGCEATPSSIDFGEVPAGPSVTQIVEILNPTADPLELNVEFSPRCRDGVFSLREGRGSRTIDPRGTLTVRVDFQSSEPGQAYSCDLSLGNQSCPNIQLTARTTPLPCQITPRQHDFGTVVVGEIYEKTFLMTNNTQSTLSGAIKRDCNLNVVVIPDEDINYSIAPGQSHVFRVQLSPTLGPGACEILVDDSICGTFPVTWVGEFPNPSCSVEPTELVVETVVGGFKSTGFELTNTGNTVLDLNVIFRGQCPQFAFLTGGGVSSLQPGNILVVKLAYQPTSAGNHACLVLPLIDGIAECGTVTILGTAVPE